VVPQTSREPLFLDRLEVRKKSADRQEISFVCVPLLINRKPVGVLGVDLRYQAERDYDGVTRLLSIVGAMVSQSIKVDHLIGADKQRLLDENIHLKQELRNATTLAISSATLVRCARFTSRLRKSLGPTPRCFCAASPAPARN